jgi:hypothetical protein
MSNIMPIHQQFTIETEALFTNLQDSLNPSLKILSEEFIHGTSSNVPYSLLKNALRFVSGEASAEQAALDAVREVTSGTLRESASSIVLMSVATACPPIAIGLAAISPILSTMDNVAMAKQFFDLLSQYQPEIRTYYRGRSQLEISSLKKAEDIMSLDFAGRQLFLGRRRFQPNQEVFGWLD